MPPKVEDTEELMRKKFRAKCQFRALGRLVIANAHWLIENIVEYEGVEDVKRRVEQAVRAKPLKKRLLNIMDKALLNKSAEKRTPKEQQYLYRKLGGLKCFKRYPNNVRRKLAALTYFKYYGPNRVIVREHQQAEAMYFIVEGEVAVSQVNYDELLREYVSVDTGTMTAGDMFGEVSLLHNIPRGATITTKGHCELLALMKEDFNNVLLALVQQQWDRVQNAMSAFTYFDGLDEMTRREGCIMAKMKSYAVNETLLGDGEGVPNFVYFILKGRCQMIESLQVYVTTRLGRKHFSLHNPNISEEGSEQSLGSGWFSAYHNKISGGTISEMKDDTDQEMTTKRHGVLKHSQRTETRESENRRQGRSVSHAVESRISRKYIKQNPSQVLLPPSNELFASSTRYSHTIPVTDIPLEGQKKKQSQPSNLRTYFMQVVIFNHGSTFGFGESMRDRRIVALTPVDCMLLPKIWLLQRNTANIWSRVQHYLEKKIPTKQKLFEEFVSARRWQEFREQIVSDVVARSRAVNFTSIHDVPYSIRMEEILDI